MFLADACQCHELAWDCGTGNGQAARGISPHFDRVIATDASAAQIRAAPASAKIEYRVVPAEASGLDDASIDLVTVGQALHWFDIPRFLAEAQRVLSPGGIIAVWSYARCRVTPVVNEIIESIFGLVEDYWPPEREIVEDRYRSIDLPVPELDAPEFCMTADWRSQDMTGYLRTWSAARRYLREHSDTALSGLEAKLHATWGDGKRTVNWPLNIRVGRLGDRPL